MVQSCDEQTKNATAFKHCLAGLDSDLAEYFAGRAASLQEDAGDSVDNVSLAQELGSERTSFLEKHAYEESMIDMEEFLDERQAFVKKFQSHCRAASDPRALDSRVSLCWHGAQCPWHRRGRCFRHCDAEKCLITGEDEITAELKALWAALRKLAASLMWRTGSVHGSLAAATCAACTNTSSVIDTVAPTPTVNYAAQSIATENVSAPADNSATPDTVIGHVALAPEYIAPQPAVTSVSPLSQSMMAIATSTSLDTAGLVSPQTPITAVKATAPQVVSEPAQFASFFERLNKLDKCLEEKFGAYV